jgi:peptidoglycan/LPS O-acetylase OafA/YrhL
MRFALLNYLRGVAALWVFAHHLSWARDEVDAPAILLRGYFGVPMFFVISGYCLAAAAKQARHRGDSTGRFLTRRLLRVYPPMWAAIGLAIGVYVLGPTMGWPAVPFGADYAPPNWIDRPAGDWIGTMALTQAFTAEGEYPWRKFQFINAVLWTLAIEVQFYLVVAAALAAGRWSRLVVAAVTAASLVAAFCPGSFRTGFFLPHWPMFALGLGLYAAIERCPRSATLSFRHRGIGLLLASGIMCAGVAIAPDEPDLGSAMMLGEMIFATGFAAVLWLLWGMREPSVSSTMLVRPFVALIAYAGLVSYTLYLIHLPLLRPAKSIAAWSGWPDWIADVLIVIAVLAICYPFHRWFERPWTSSARRKASPPIYDAAKQE